MIDRPVVVRVSRYVAHLAQVRCGNVTTATLLQVARVEVVAALHLSPHGSKKLIFRQNKRQAPAQTIG